MEFDNTKKKQFVAFQKLKAMNWFQVYNTYPFSCCNSLSDNPVISITVATSIPFASIFLAISRLRWFIPFSIPFSIPSASPSSFPSLLAVSIEFLMSRYAILLASYSRCSCGVNFAISASSKRRSNTLSHKALGRCVSL